MTEVSPGGLAAKDMETIINGWRNVWVLNSFPKGERTIVLALREAQQTQHRAET